MVACPPSRHSDSTKLCTHPLYPAFTVRPARHGVALPIRPSPLPIIYLSLRLPVPIYRHPSSLLVSSDVSSRLVLSCHSSVYDDVPVFLARSCVANVSPAIVTNNLSFITLHQTCPSHHHHFSSGLSSLVPVAAVSSRIRSQHTGITVQPAKRAHFTTHTFIAVMSRMCVACPCPAPKLLFF